MERTTAFYYCPCYKSSIDQASAPRQREEAEEEEDAPLDLSDKRLPYALFPIEELYFCDDCHVHRCPRCVTEEVVSTYCPNCLFEVPQQQSGTPHRHCPRNCFQCPVCQSALQVAGSDKAGYTMTCPYCAWSSQQSGLTFTRPTHLASQMAAQRPDVKAQRYALVRQQVWQCNGRDKPEAASPGARLYQRYKDAMRLSGEEEGPAAAADGQYTAAIMTPEPHAFTHDLLKCNTLDSRLGFRDKAQHLPLPTPLRSKRTKRCRQCRLLLVKPDPRPVSLHFRSRLYARTVLPTLSFTSAAAAAAAAISTYPASVAAPTLPTQTQQQQWLLRIVNPMPEAITVSLGTEGRTGDADTRVVIVTPNLTIGPATESWQQQHHDDDDHDPNNHDEQGKTRIVTAATHGELYAASRNSATVVLEISSSGSGSNSSGKSSAAAPSSVRLAVFVQVKWLALDDRSPHDKVEKQLGFWTVLGEALPR